MSKRRKPDNKHVPQARLAVSVLSALPLGMTAGVAMIVVVAFLAYLPSISGGFVLDDNTLLTNNSLIRAPGGLYHFWCTSESLDYWPATNTTFWIEWRLWGMHPAGYHATNLIFHIVESLLIWVMLRKLSIPGAFLAAVLFTVHPVNVESVAWIASRKNLTAMLFFLLSILWYLKADARLQLDYKRGAGRCYWLSLAAFALAMLSKGSVAVLPVLLLGMVWWQRKVTKRDLVLIAPFFLVAAALAAVNVWFQTHGTETVYRRADFMERLLGAGGMVWFYLYKALLPFDLSFIYSQWRIEADKLLWWLPLLAAAAVAAVLWLYRRGWSRPLLFAWGVFCVALVPVLGFTDVGFMEHSLVANRYQHVAIISVIALTAALWSAWHRRARTTTGGSALIVACMAVAALVFLTYRQSGIYHDNITLYQATLEKNQDSWLAHNNLGIALSDIGHLQEAIDHYKQALRLHSDYPDALNNLGLALMRTGSPKEAIECYRQALDLKPDYPEAINNLGIALVQIGLPEEAIKHYERLLLLNPDYAAARNNLGVALIQAGRPGLAIEHLKQAMQSSPGYVDAYKNLAVGYARMGKYSEAVATATRALELARLQGQAEQAKEIEDLLNSMRAGRADSPNTSPASKSAPPQP